MLKISPLFSGSKGNCTLIQSGSVNVLLDAGFGYRATIKALQSRSLSPKDIDAIVVSHEHTDHVGAIPMWTRQTPTPIYAPKLISDLIRQRVYFSEVYDIDGSFCIGDISVDIFKCSHDAACCFGYKFTCGDSAFASVTDTGIVTDELTRFLYPCQAVMLESNHDEDMLKRGEYSYTLKQRILSACGHLSNAQAAEVLRRLTGGNVKTVVLAHLSENNNTHELAFNSAVAALASCGAVEGKDVCVYVADQYNNEVTICLD